MGDEKKLLEAALFILPINLNVLHMYSWMKESCIHVFFGRLKAKRISLDTLT